MPSDSLQAEVVPAPPPPTTFRMATVDHIKGAPIGAEGWVLHGCKCPDCRDAYYAFGDTPRERRRNCPVKPLNIHGTWNGANNYACKCDRCLGAIRARYAENAAYRKANRMALQKKQRDLRRARRSGEAG